MSRVCCQGSLVTVKQLDSEVSKEEKLSLCLRRVCCVQLARSLLLHAAQLAAANQAQRCVLDACNSSVQNVSLQCLGKFPRAVILS